MRIGQQLVDADMIGFAADDAQDVFADDFLLFHVMPLAFQGSSTAVQRPQTTEEDDDVNAPTWFRVLPSKPMVPEEEDDGYTNLDVISLRSSQSSFRGQSSVEGPGPLPHVADTDASTATTASAAEMPSSISSIASGPYHDHEGVAEVCEDDLLEISCYF